MAGTDAAAAPAAHDASERLAKRLARELGCSRSLAEQYIEGGHVQVDGRTVESPAERVQPGQQVALAAGASARPEPPVTLLWHKPAGVAAASADEALPFLSAERHWADDPAPRRLLQRHFRQLIAAAPLPASASGLVVFTQDPRIARRLQDPTAPLEHECLAEVQGAPAAQGLGPLAQGLVLPGQRLPPIKASWQSEQRLRLPLKGVDVALVPALCDALGLAVTGLRRLRIGRVPLARLPEGQWRYLPPWDKF